MKLKSMKRLLMLLFMTVLLGGCAAEVATSSRRYVWPRPPDQPKIEWIKSYYSAASFPKSSFSQFMEIVFGSPEAQPFEKPIDIKSNNKGLVFITDTIADGIFIYDLNNSRVTFWSKGTDLEKSMAITPYFLSIDASENIYVVGLGSRYIYVLDQNGTVVKRISYDAKVKTPAGILVDSVSGRIYLVDTGDSKVAVFDLAGNFLFDFGKPGEKAGEFNRPSPICMNGKGEIIIGDTMNARVQIFDKNGKFLRKFGERGDGDANFQILKGVATDSDNNIYVTDGKANQIKIFNDQGQFLMRLGAAYSVTSNLKEAPGGILLPQGIHIDSSDNIYVVDQANLRFQIFRYLKNETVNKESVKPQKGS